MSGGGIRVARNVAAGAVAAIAAWSSYSHMVHVALGYHERPQVAYALRPYPTGVGQAGSPAHTAHAGLPRLHEQAGTKVEPAPTPRQSVGEVPPAARGHAPHDSGEVPTPRQVPPLHQVPPLQQ